MKNLISLITFLLMLSTVFAIDMGITAQPAATMQPTYAMCAMNDPPNERCFQYARPITLADCNLLKPDFNNYNSLLLSCYSKIGACDKLTDSIDRDNCYKNKLECEKISSDEKKASCVSALNQKNFNSTMGTIFSILLFVIFIFSPLIILGIIGKTIFDLIKKNPISSISWIIRLALIFGLILLWLGLVIFVAFPPMYY